ncbi:Dipeptidyl-peptidase 5 [Rubrobacter xylanophilus DSM 9941]|nr:Dipeptidyl-peptidase 5 [Rubrobacter xylanophilus DSM 9941]
MEHMSEERRFTAETLISLPRFAGLALSNDGERLVASVVRPDKKRRRLVTSLYELAPGAPPRRITRSAPGEGAAAFAPDGSLLFVSRRPDPEADEEERETGERPALWLLPPGGEARPLAAPPGGVEGFAVARESGDLLIAARVRPGGAGWREDAEWEKARKEAGVEAQLFEGYPIRLWDHYLGPRERHLYFAPLPEGEDERIEEPRELLSGTPLELSAYDITPDGSTAVVTRWSTHEDLAARVMELVAVDVSTGEVRTLADDAWYSSPRCSPDGRRVVAIREERSTPERPGDRSLWLFDLSTGEGRNLLEEFDLWPGSPAWSPDSNIVFFTASCDGRVPVFRVPATGGSAERLTGEGAFSDLCPAPDGRTVYALRSTVGEPPHPVALDTAAPEEAPRRMGSFPELERIELPARIRRVEARASDGTRVPSWLLLPKDATPEKPAPLAVLIHGGPLNSWDGWHWRWNPHVFADDGWAVLLPDPALSTGYGIHHIRRGWGRWGEVVYDDLMRAVEAAAELPEVDGGRAAALGGSFGGYMVNWIAGHTERFRALVAHASLWNLEGFHGTTDLGTWWEREFGNPYQDPSRYRENSPHLRADRIKTPMLVIHGELDYRVPVSEALSLWTSLKRHGVEAKFLHFPDENHWVIKPNNALLWYRTVLAFIDHHVRGRRWRRPELL